MGRYKESEYRYAVYRHNRYGGGTSLHSKHMTQKRAKESLSRAKGRGWKGFIRKLK